MKVFFCIMFTFAILSSGCSTTRDAEYYRMWDATQRVLVRNKLVVRESDFREDTLIATSKVHGDFLNKTRVKVVARIAEDQDGHWEPRIRVVNQWDNAEAKAWGNPAYQDSAQWINLNSNAAFEARIYNEIMEEIGIYNPYEGKGFRPTQKDSTRTIEAEPIPLHPY